ncbi:hypothetical protein NC653_006310 [Populus alba x Populus x berolinensis]|uniref:Uncharacterized protein n=1 Tax=Populus alba x Populus x berolinensis TaxID=444605 RepID=A0AAD6REI2_9ROSI|nr:hypothetical protein NC653_006310 [Populus alba x Populus x berolinensis]
MRFFDENRIKIAYYDQRKYASSNLSNNENERVRSLVETSNGDGDMMRPPISKFGCDTGVNDMICNNWFVYRKKSLYFIYGLIISIYFILS